MNSLPILICDFTSILPSCLSMIFCEIASPKPVPTPTPFVVYPAKDGVYTSLRAEVLYDAFQDIRVCCALEEHIGREQVVRMIDEAAGCNLRFDDYPRGKEFLEQLREAMTELLARYSV